MLARHGLTVSGSRETQGSLFRYPVSICRFAIFANLRSQQQTLESTIESGRNRPTNELRLNCDDIVPIVLHDTGSLRTTVYSSLVVVPPSS